MYQYGFDECATNAPSWYATVDRSIEKDNYDEAARLAREAWQSAQNAGDAAAEGIALNALVKVMIAKGDAWTGRKFAQMGIEVATKAKSKNQEAMANHMAAKVELKDRKLADAKKLADSAKKLYDDAKNPKGAASALITTAKAQIAKKEAEEAFKTLQGALASLKEIDEQRGILAALYAVFELKMKEDMVYPALQTMEEIVDKCKDLGDAFSQASAEFSSAEIQLSQGNLQEALRCAGTAAELFESVGDVKKKGSSVFIMATAFKQGGQGADAEEAGDVAFKCFKAAREKRGQAGALVLLAQICAEKQGLADAAYKFNEAAFLYRQLKDNKTEAKTLGSLCAVLMDQVEAGAVSVKEPIRHASRAALLFEDTDTLNTAVAAKTQMILAKALLLEKEDLDEAVTAANAAVAAFQAISNKLGEAQATEVLSKIQFGMKDKATGVETAQKAVELYQEAGDAAGATAAEALVASEGKPKTGAIRQLSWIDIFFEKRMYTQFIEFEARQARYSSVSGGGGGGASSAEALMDGSGAPAKPNQGKVAYAIRWQRVANLDLLSLDKK